MQICKALALAGVKVEDKDLHAGKLMKRRGWKILKFKDRKFKYEVMENKKKLMEKKNELRKIHFEESLFLSDSVCTENRNHFYKCHQLKNGKRIHACWFLNNAINVQLMDKGPIFKIFHESDLQESLHVNVDDLLSNCSS